MLLGPMKRGEGLRMVVFLWADINSLLVVEVYACWKLKLCWEVIKLLNTDNANSFVEIGDFIDDILCIGNSFSTIVAFVIVIKRR